MNKTSYLLALLGLIAAVVSGFALVYNPYVGITYLAIGFFLIMLSAITHEPPYRK